LSQLLAPARLLAESKTFDFKDPKSVNTVTVTLDSLLEPIAGVASGVTGSLLFDPDRPREASGKIVIDVASLQFPNSRYTEAAHGPRGLEVQKYPQIEFVLKRVRDVRKEGTNSFSGTVEGDFTCHGVTKPITVPVRAVYLPGKARDRNRQMEGDLLVLRTTFTIKRTDYGIANGVLPELVADEVEIRAAVVGLAPQSPQSARR
jgi:polyisoprenoid-binding protein YceI